MRAAEAPLRRKSTRREQPRIEAEEDQRYQIEWRERQAASAGFFDTRQRREFGADSFFGARWRANFIATCSPPRRIRDAVFPSSRPERTPFFPLDLCAEGTARADPGALAKAGRLL
jgi:hypothetical protein